MQTFHMQTRRRSEPWDVHETKLDAETLHAGTTIFGDCYPLNLAPHEEALPVSSDNDFDITHWELEGNCLTFSIISADKGG